MSATLDADGQPRNVGFNLVNNELKAVNTLYGLCMGVVADGVVDDDEVLFLDTWLKENERFLSSYPLNVVHDRIARILSDGIITSSEREDLYAMLGDLIGGGFHETGAAGGTSTQFPVDEIAEIDFAGATFCFTGKFIFGQRSACEEVVIALGAVASKNVTKKVNYLVIGELASRDWVASSHGRKIEKALYFKEKGVPVMILSEKDWVGFV